MRGLGEVQSWLGIALKGGYCLPSSPAGSFARTASKQARKLSSLVESSSNGTIWPRARTSGSCGFLSTGSSSLSFCCSIALKIFIDGEFPQGSSRPTNTWTTTRTILLITSSLTIDNVIFFYEEERISNTISNVNLIIIIIIKGIQLLKETCCKEFIYLKVQFVKIYYYFFKEFD